MKPKKLATLSGKLMFPLCIGCRALILHDRHYTHTSKVVAIHSVQSGEIRFETENTHYRLLPAAKSQKAECCSALSVAA